MKPPPTAADSTANQEPISTHFLLRGKKIIKNKEGQVPSWRLDKEYLTSRGLSSNFFWDRVYK